MEPQNKSYKPETKNETKPCGLGLGDDVYDACLNKSWGMLIIVYLSKLRCEQVL